LVGLELADDNLFNCFSEADSVDDPKTAAFLSCGSGGSIDFIEKGQLAKTLSCFEGFGGIFFNFDLDCSRLYDVETCASSALPKDNGSLRHFCPKHMFFNVIQLFI
jgi:hypothetical protein